MNTTMRKTCSIFAIIVWHPLLLGAMTVLAMFASIPYTSPSGFLKAAPVKESKAGETAGENLAVSNYQLEQNYPTPL